MVWLAGLLGGGSGGGGGQSLFAQFNDIQYVTVEEQFYRLGLPGIWGQGAVIDAAIVAAQQAAKVARKNVYLSPGMHVITQSIVYDWDNTTTDADKTNAIFLGGNVSDDVINGSPSTFLRWEGTNDDPMIDIRSRGVTVQGIAFRCGSGRSTQAAVSIGKGNGGACTRCRVSFCHIWQTPDPSTGDFEFGVIIAPVAATNNQEFNDIDHCVIDGVNRSAIYLASSTGQSKQNRITRVAMLGPGNGVETNVASFVADTCSVRVNGSAFLLSAPVDVITIRNLDSELCGAVITRVGGTSASWPVILDGARVSQGDNTILIGGVPCWINNVAPGPLVLMNVNLEKASVTTDPSTFRVRQGTTLGSDGQVVAIGCSFLGPNPFLHGGGAVAPLRVTSLGNKYTVFDPSPPFGITGRSRLRDGTRILPVQNDFVLTDGCILDIPAGSTGDVLKLQADGTVAWEPP